MTPQWHTTATHSSLRPRRTSCIASIEAMQEVLRGRSEECVAVVCHWGVINALCGDGADNCTVVECRRRPNGHLDVERHHDPPRAPRTK